MLTPEERRGALLILSLVMLGAAWDAGHGLWKKTPPPSAPDVVGATRPASSGGGAAPPATPPDTAAGMRAAVVDVNRAGTAELDALPGIGPVLAQRIVEHRGRNGAFRSIEELRAVRGIGPSLIARLRGRVRFGS